jgi:hypothetical protein
MKKIAYFGAHWGEGWPDLHEVERFFLSRAGRPRLAGTRPDDASFGIEGADGTHHLPSNGGRIDIHLDIDVLADYGALLFYRKWGGGLKESYWSRGDVSRLREAVRNVHGTPLPVGLFIPFETAWLAVKEFLETDGQLPANIDWLDERDLPPDTFPPP